MPRKKTIKRSRHIKHKYKNLVLLILGLLLAFGLARQESIHSTLLSFGTLGYAGAFVAGMLFVISFTAPIGAVLLLVLAEGLSPIEIGLVAGLGAMMSDLFIFRFVRDDLLSELAPIYNSLGGTHLTKLLHTKLFSWTLPVMGAVVIASPLPDELGVSLLGLSRMSYAKFIIVSFILNFLGIFLIVSASLVIKP